MHDHFSAIGFFLPRGTNPLVLAGEAVRQGSRSPGGVPGITVLTHAWEPGEGLGIWAVTHEERKDLLTIYPVFHAGGRRPFSLAEMEWDGAEAVARGSLGGLPVAFHVSNYCRDSLWEVSPGTAGSAVIAGIGYGARLRGGGTPAGAAAGQDGRGLVPGELRPAHAESKRFNQETCDFAFYGRITSARLIRNPVTFVRLWRLTLVGDRPVPWELDVVLPRAWLQRPWFFSRPRPGSWVAGLCWLQGEFTPTATEEQACPPSMSGT